MIKTKNPQASHEHEHEHEHDEPQDAPPPAPLSGEPLGEEPAGPHRCGFITLLGAPNVGKSTLLNRLIGERIAITSARPQTTRNRIPGVLTRPNSQLILIDTPGLHDGKSALNRYMDIVAHEAVGDSDLIALIVEAGVGPDMQVGVSQITLRALETLRAHEKRVFLIINKIDRLPREHLLPIMDAYKDSYPFEQVVPISGLKGDGVEGLLRALSAALPEGPALYPEDHITDLPERFFAAEIVREKLFRRLDQEVPYSTAVTIDTWRDLGERGTTIEATIHVERDSQKGIVIGKGGAQLKEIGTQARQHLERLLNTRVHLRLFVRVEPRWTRSERAMKKLGYEERR
ncbi:MAG: GTPase Era [Deltaproteobacteria bacterium]|nr:GTPase Era [Deltaproteobacteria bacterium]